MIKYRLRTKIVLDNKSIDQVSHFRYLGCDATYDVDYDVDHKLAKLQSICGTVRQALQKETRKATRPESHKVMAVPVLLYDSET